jgi:succinate dehydrogenase / fumarate reductase membrane anchor subunit
MDYIKPTGVRVLLHAVTVLALIGYLGWAAQVLWRL